jgi:hypothetical protein
MERGSWISLGVRVWRFLDGSDQSREERWSRASAQEFQRVRVAMIVTFTALTATFLMVALVSWIFWNHPTRALARYIVIGASLLYAVMIVFAGVQALQRWKVYECQNTGRCLACGYNLWGIPLLCPECGTPIPSESIVTVTFTANDTMISQDDELIVVNICCRKPAQTVTLQRSLPIGEDDWGIYVEYNGQRNSAFDKIAHCTLEHDRLTLELVEPIGHGPRYIGFEVKLGIAPLKWTALAAGLQQIFAGNAERQFAFAERGN